MSDIEYIDLVIRIPKAIYKASQIIHVKYEDVTQIPLEVITNGIPLPKGHKRLIEDNFEVGTVFDEEGNRVGYKYVTQEDLNNATTIVDADKESE